METPQLRRPDSDNFPQADMGSHTTAYPEICLVRPCLYLLAGSQRLPHLEPSDPQPSPDHHVQAAAAVPQPGVPSQQASGSQGPLWRSPKEHLKYTLMCR